MLRRELFNQVQNGEDQRVYRNEVDIGRAQVVQPEQQAHYKSNWCPRGQTPTSQYFCHLAIRILPALTSPICLWLAIVASPEMAGAATYYQQFPTRTSWPLHGGDAEETRFSPLRAIDTGTVRNLALAWVTEVQSGREKVEATLIVADGLIFGTAAWNFVFALDASTGAQRWNWDPAIVRGGARESGPVLCCGAVNRGVAVANGRVYVGLLDGRLIAMTADSGKIVWVRQTTPLGVGYSITGAPRVVRNMAVIGNGGAEYGVRGYVSAYDLNTGEIVWRFYTVPGDPSLPFESLAMEIASKTWTGEWWKYGGGGTIWDGMAYDRELDLLYVGVGNGAPWPHLLRSPQGGDNLYLASIVALRARDGSLVWHYQLNPGENWDYTATQNIVLATLAIEGAERKVLMQAAKNGFFYVIDRLSGKLISAKPFAHVTWASAIDYVTGRPLENSSARYGNTGAWISPGPLGAHTWPPMSWNAQLGMVFIPGQNSAFYYSMDSAASYRVGSYGSGLGRALPLTPAPPLPPAFFLVAWDPVRQSPKWIVRSADVAFTGTLATAGDVVFVGRSSGFLEGYNAKSGDLIWRHAVGPNPSSPVSFELAGRQYISILTGGDTRSGSRVWTFALPR